MPLDVKPQQFIYCMLQSFNTKQPGIDEADIAQKIGFVFNETKRVAAISAFLSLF
jgi:hypothetical protein